MKRWVLEITIDTVDGVTQEAMNEVGRQIEDDAAMRVDNEIEGEVCGSDLRQVL